MTILVFEADTFGTEGLDILLFQEMVLDLKMVFMQDDKHS